MLRLAPYLLALFVVAVCGSAFFLLSNRPPIVTQYFSPTISSTSPTASASAGQTTAPTATTTITKVIEPQVLMKQAPRPAAAAPSSSAPAIPTVTQAPVASSSILLDYAAVSALRNALVNIVCDAPAGSGLRSISGSGVVVDPKGIILTNAHVAQYFLLANRNVSCAVRTGSPAVDSYRAALIYISPAWLRANPNVLIEVSPGGSGEYDFAFLAIMKPAEGAATAILPAPFAFIPLGTMPPAPGTPIIIASYGAQFLTPDEIRSALFPTVAFGSVKNVYTFVANTIDVLALGGSAAAQEGSSGGGVADASGTLVGTITTSTISGPTATRSLAAITASYIRAEYAGETGNALDLLLAEPIPASVADFAPRVPALESIIIANLK